MVLFSVISNCHCREAPKCYYIIFTLSAIIKEIQEIRRIKKTAKTICFLQKESVYLSINELTAGFPRACCRLLRMITDGKYAIFLLQTLSADRGIQ